MKKTKDRDRGGIRNGICENESFKILHMLKPKVAICFISLRQWCMVHWCVNFTLWAYLHFCFVCTCSESIPWLVPLPFNIKSRLLYTWCMVIVHLPFGSSSKYSLNTNQKDFWSSRCPVQLFIITLSPIYQNMWRSSNSLVFIRKLTFITAMALTLHISRNALNYQIW